MDEERTFTRHYWIRGAILAGFSVYIAYLAKSGKLIYYIAPQMEPFVKLGAILLFIIAVFQIWLAVQSGQEDIEACGCEHVPSSSPVKNTVLYSLFLIPLLLGLLLPDTVMGSQVAAIKGMNLNARTAAVNQPAPPASVPVQTAAAAPQSSPAAAQEPLAASAAPPEAEQSKPAARESDPIAPGSEAVPAAGHDPLDALFPTDTFTKAYAGLGKKLYGQDLIQIREKGFMELLTTLDLYKDAFMGKSVQITGFVYREDGMSPDQFVVSRMAMQCCSADTTPFGVMVQSAAAAHFPKDSWVKLTGKLSTTVYNDMTILKIDAVTIQKTEPSTSPYVYPFVDDFSQLAGNEP
ncbi:TIGR03943 family putative permease subunit [Paenibacillus sp. TAB 01]|uniref:TIGR03943 family putative permease subunit n=1 Tax=Paenibacillus sp. TAB 01 TaxID=3368988 RepID=UPI0037507130